MPKYQVTITKILELEATRRLDAEDISWIVSENSSQMGDDGINVEDLNDSKNDYTYSLKEIFQEIAEVSEIGGSNEVNS